MKGGRHTVRVAVIALLTSAALVALFWKASLTPTSASAEAEAIDRLVRLLFSIGGVVLALCLVLLIYSIIVFRRRAGDAQEGPPQEGHPPLEMAWTLVPLALVLYLAFQGALVLRDITRPAPEALEVKVTALQWGWLFEYPQQGITSGELRLPVDRPVLFRLTSRDVVHSFWVPEFRVKQDAVPGRELVLRVTPTRVGSYKLWCAELCGLGHAVMAASVKVVELGEFEAWVKEQRR